MKIFIKSCHATLEYDQARMLHNMGYHVGGNFDIGSKQRKKLPGITDTNSNIDEFDTILLHQTEDFDLVMESFLQQGKKVILSAFGQGCDRQHINVSNLCKQYENAYVSSYSVKDYNMYVGFGCPSHKIEMIRFGKYLDDFKPWKGKWPLCYISCNAINRRGAGCGWEILKAIENSGLPIILSGNETAENTEFGLGEIDEKAMHNTFSNAMCHLHLGTIPAPITLSLLEAFCSGTPVVAYNNQHGLINEGFEIDFYDDAQGLAHGIHRMLTDESYRQEQHKKSLRNAKYFNIHEVAPKWRTLLEKLK